jgi:hypothetical protein
MSRVSLYARIGGLYAGIRRPASGRIAAMRGREKARFRRVGVIGIAALIALLALGFASPAVAKKKKKK